MMAGMRTSDEDEFTEQLRSQTLAAFGLKAWRAGLAPVPRYVRLCRAVTFAKRRGKVVDWESYNAAEAEHRARQEVFAAELPGRAREVTDQLSGLLPDGLRFEWAPDGEQP
jgi:hypothetical protein